jgi:polysaccharide biosynthesis/export protein
MMRANKNILFGWICALCLSALILVCAVGCAKDGGAVQASPENGVQAEQLPVADEADSAALKAAVGQMQQDESQRRRTYRIGPEDVLRVTVWMREDLSKEGKVKDDGTFFVPLIGNQQAEGRTVAEFQQQLTVAMTEYLRRPQLDVEIIQYQSKVFYLAGQIREPGVYPIKATTTLMEAVSSGKGFTDKANLGDAYLIHNRQVVPVDFQGVFKGGRLEGNLHLDDGDVIYVPSMETTRVYVLGEVLRPAAVPIRGGKITLAEAIAEAGGFNNVSAYTKGIKVIRGNLSDPRVYTIDFTETLRKGRGMVAFLEPGDIVFVPASGLAKWDRVMGQILPSLSRIVVDAAAIDAISNR